jgi:hypothetical protein
LKTADKDDYDYLVKYLFAGLCLLVSISPSWAIQLEEIVRLTEMKTSDEIILQLLSQNRLDKPLTTSDVLYLKEKGVSDQVITSLLTEASADKYNLPPQEGESYWLNATTRYYYTIGEDGNKRMVVTNLDEQGNPMGPPPPPRPEPAQYTYEAPQEAYAPLPSVQPQLQPAYGQTYAPQMSYPADFSYYPAPTIYTPYYNPFPFYALGFQKSKFHSSFGSGFHSPSEFRSNKCFFPGKSHSGGGSSKGRTKH